MAHWGIFFDMLMLSLMGEWDSTVLRQNNKLCELPAKLSHTWAPNMEIVFRENKTCPGNVNCTCHKKWTQRKKEQRNNSQSGCKMILSFKLSPDKQLMVKPFKLIVQGSFTINVQTSRTQHLSNSHQQCRLRCRWEWSPLLQTFVSHTDGEPLVSLKMAAKINNIKQNLKSLIYFFFYSGFLGMNFLDFIKWNGLTSVFSLNHNPVWKKLPSVGVDQGTSLAMKVYPFYWQTLQNLYHLRFHFT